MIWFDKVKNRLDNRNENGCGAYATNDFPLFSLICENV